MHLVKLVHSGDRTSCQLRTEDLTLLGIHSTK